MKLLINFVTWNFWYSRLHYQPSQGYRVFVVPILAACSKLVLYAMTTFCIELEVYLYIVYWAARQVT